MRTTDMEPDMATSILPPAVALRRTRAVADVADRLLAVVFDFEAAQHPPVAPWPTDDERDPGLFGPIRHGSPRIAPIDGHRVTEHALCRMHERRVNAQHVAFALEHGRTVWCRGARLQVVGRREIRRAELRGVEVPPRAEGVQVVCAVDEETIITVYRNRDLRGCRER